VTDLASPRGTKAPARRAWPGLTSDEAARRLRADGPNSLPASRAPHLLRLVVGVLGEPMFLLLCAAVGLYVFLGDIREAMVLAASLVVVVTITVAQERRAGRALAALRELSSPRVAVYRDGELQRVSGREIVRGDVVLLSEGDRVPADGLLRESTELEIDESLLTGESLPVAKRPARRRREVARPHEDSHGCVYSGTLVVRGHGVAEIVTIGAATEAGRIGRELESPRSRATPLLAEIRRLVRWLAALGVLLCIAVALLHTLLRGDWVAGALAGITLAMGILPEEFPVVLTVFLALGAWRLSKHNVLTRSMPAIEALGAATVLAVDKTGTLTENRMVVAALDDGTSEAALGDDVALDHRMRRVLGAALAACEIDAVDPMERAIAAAAGHHAPDEARQLEGMALVHEYELTAQLPAVTHVWKPADAGAFRVASKGAPETLIALCRLGPEAAARMLRRAERLAREGLRVLAVADGAFHAAEFPASPDEFELRLLGFVGLKDPVRKGVPAALELCRSAGIRVIMITGDHVATAHSIARAVGLDDSSGALTGAQLSAMGESELREAVRHVNVYARTPPDEKLRLVRALQSGGSIVAMTGDGVNDAPALRAAHIGIAMGRRGADVAREAAALVLLDDDFAGLVTGIGAGRRIYENLRNAMSYLLAAHIPLAGLGLLPLLFGWPLLLFPLHVVFIEFVIDPACSLVFETERRGVEDMKRPPRDPRRRLFSGTFMLESAALGLASLAATLLVCGIALQSLPEDEARALGFVSLISGNLALILVNRSRGDTLAKVLQRPNPAFWWICSLAAAALAFAIAVPAAADAFGFARPPAPALAGAATLGCGVVLVSGYLRTIRHRRSRSRLRPPRS